MKLSSPYIPIILLFISVQLISFNGSPPFSYTDAPGEGLCSSCHTQDINSGLGDIYICVGPSGNFICQGNETCNFPTTLDPNTTYSIKVILENCSAGKQKAGFQLVALDGNEITSSSIGTFSNLGTNVEATSPSGGYTNRVYLKHSGGAKSFSSNVITYTADWTSPSTITGPIYFYAAGVIANGNNGSSGDLVKSTSITTGALAVELLDFKVQQLNAKEVELTWATASETNSDYFEVLRSVNGVDYETLEKLAAAGFSTQTLSYTFTDKQPILNRTTFYRLKQVDKDGQFTYTPTQSLEVLDFQENKMTFLPNPVQQGACIFVDFLATQNYPNATLQVFDMAGREIADLKTMMPNGLIEGFNKIIVDTTNLPEGIYFLNVHDGRAVLANQTVVVSQ